MARTSRIMLLMLAAFTAATFLSPVWSVQSAPTSAKFTVSAGETVVTTVGDVEVEITATEDVIVFLAYENGTVYGMLEPHPDAEGDPFVTVTVLPDHQVLFRGVVYDRILAYFFMSETGHTEL